MASIKEYFEDNGNYTKLISLLAAKQSDIFYFLKEMELRMSDENGMEIEYVYAPSVTCHTTRHVQTFPYYDKHKILFGGHGSDIIDKKYVVSSTRPLFMTTPWEDLAEGASFEDKREFITHIPLEKVPESRDPAVVTIPRQRVLSIFVRGPHIPMCKIVKMLKEESKQHNLEVCGPLYLITMVGPHLGLDIPEERYLARIMLPIK